MTSREHACRQTAVFDLLLLKSSSHLHAARERLIERGALYKPCKAIGRAELSQDEAHVLDFESGVSPSLPRALLILRGSRPAARSPRGGRRRERSGREPRSLRVCNPPPYCYKDCT